MADLKITLELEGTLQLEALESALEMFEAFTEDPPPDLTARDKLVHKAGLALLARVRGPGGKRS